VRGIEQLRQHQRSALCCEALLGPGNGQGCAHDVVMINHRSRLAGYLRDEFALAENIALTTDDFQFFLKVGPVSNCGGDEFLGDGLDKDLLHEAIARATRDRHIKKVLTRFPGFYILLGRKLYCCVEYNGLVIVCKSVASFNESN